MAWSLIISLALSQSFDEPKIISSACVKAVEGTTQAYAHPNFRPNWKAIKERLKAAKANASAIQPPRLDTVEISAEAQFAFEVKKKLDDIGLNSDSLATAKRIQEACEKGIKAADTEFDEATTAQDRVDARLNRAKFAEALKFFKDNGYIKEN